MFVIFSFRSLRKSIFEYNLFSNRYLVGGVSIGIFLTIVAIYLPFLQGLLGTVTLPPLWALGVILVALINVAAIEVVKWWFRKRG
jgi:magnesium-transporting ATPase (P-type)